MRLADLHPGMGRVLEQGTFSVRGSDERLIVPYVKKTAARCQVTRRPKGKNSEEGLRIASSQR